MKNIKGISPITKEPFNESDLKRYGPLKDEKDLLREYGSVDIFDYHKILDDFLEFKKHNPELVEKPSSDISNATSNKLDNSTTITPKL